VKTSDWNTNDHKIIVEVFFPTEPGTGGESLPLTIHLNVDEMFAFKTEEGRKVILLDEQPGVLVGQAKFSLQFENDTKIYEADGHMWHLTPKDWGLDESTFMVTLVEPNYVILNGDEYNHISVIEPSDNLLGKIVRMDMDSETFIYDKPGSSYFTYKSLSDESSFKTIAPSIKSLWKPSAEQMNNSITVAWIGKATLGMSGHIIGMGLSDGKLLYLGEPTTPIPNWINIGNRLVRINNIYVDLETGILIEGGQPPTPARPIRTIPKNWP